MGNIISDTTGTADAKISNTSFSKYINDTLLELDLYNVDPNTGQPRTNFEVDYTSTGISSRPKDSNGNLIDIQGIKYSASNDQKPADKNSLGSANQLSNTDSRFSPTNGSNWRNISKYYNFKRGVCNSTTKVPVNTVGSIYNTLSPSIKSQVDSCLISGATNGPSSSEAIAQGDPLFNIPDINPATDTLNIGPNSLANSTVYGNPMSEECNKLLNSTLTNSYITTDIKKYTKLNSILDPSITTLDSNFGNQRLITSTNGDILFVNSGDEGNNHLFPNGGTKSAHYWTDSNGTVNTNIYGNTSANVNVQGDCSTFYSELCNYYYYNDFVDGIQFNPDLISHLTPSNSSNFTKNVDYVTQHIPDCRCVNNIGVQNNVANPATSGNTSTSTSGSVDDITYFYVSNKCNAVAGKLTEYGQPSTGSNIGFKPLAQTLYSAYNNISGILGFGTQFDPADNTVLTTGMSDGTFLFAEDARGSNYTFSTYICNMAQTIGANNNGGNVTIAGISMNCSFPNSESNSSNTSSQSSTSNPPPPSNNNPNLNVTINTPPVNLNDYTEPVDPFYSLSATITNLNPAYTFYSNNNPNYGFAFQSVNNPSQILFGTYTCGSGSNAAASATLCNSATQFTILTPFIYDTTTNEYGVDYNLFIENLPGNNTNTITPSVPIPIMLKQYAMQITDVIPGDFGLSLRFNIQFNCISRPSIPYAVILSPVTPSAANIPIIMAGTDFFQDVINKKGLIQGQSAPPINSSLADGFLLIGPNSSGDSPIKLTNYTYKILLNPTASNGSSGQITYSGGYIMNFSNSVPPNYSGTSSAIDFSNYVSAFNSASISYLDVTNNNQITLFPKSNSIATFGATLILNWSFVNKDNYTGFNINCNIGSSTTPLLIANVGILTLSYEFVMPITLAGQQMSFYIEAYGSSNTPPASNLQSSMLTITSTPVPTSPAVFNGFNILTNNTVTNQQPLSLLSAFTGGKTIYDYLSAIDLIGASGDNAIIYDYSLNQWSSGTIMNTASSNLTNSPSSSSTTIAFQLPKNIPTMTFTLTNSKSDGTSTPISTGSAIQIGALLTVNWILSAGFAYDTQVQINLYGIVYDTFTILKGTTTGTYQFTLYDITGGLSSATTDMKLTYLRTSAPSLTGLTIINPFINTTTKPNSSNSLTLSSVNPLVYISPNSSNLNSINSVNVTLTNPLNDNVYFNVFNGYNSPLSVNTHIMTLQNVNYSQPIKINFTSGGASHFTNVYEKLRKNKKEHFGNIAEGSKKKKIIEGLSGNTLLTNVLRLDLSQSNFGNSAIVNYVFNNYSSVSIQSLELYFGTTFIDNSTFNISFTSNQSPFNVEVGSVRIIGIMTGKVFFPIAIPGATQYYYSTNTYGANGWASSFALVNNNNGYYSISPSDNSAVSTANSIALNPPSSSNSSNISNAIANISNAITPSDNSGGSNMLLYIGILVVLIILGIVAYFMFNKKSKK